MIDLPAEFSAAASTAGQKSFDRLIALGVPHEFVWHGPMRYGVASIATADDGTYQPIDNGKRAFILPAIPLLHYLDERYDGADEIGDLVAWYADKPSRWWCRTGMLPILNPAAILGAELYREPLKIWACPLSWLRAGGEGIVILDPDADLRFWLGAVTKLQCESVNLGREIERRLREPSVKMPQILVPTQRQAA